AFRTVESGQGALARSRRTHRLSATLVVSEVALSLVLLIGAGLMLRSLLHLQQVNPGFNPERLLTTSLSLPLSRYPQEHQRASFFRQVRERVERLPAVRSASIVTCLPLGGGCWDNVFSIEGRPAPARQDLPTADFNVISPGYFRTLSVRLMKGRYFDEHDSAASLPVAIINESAVR